MNVKLELYRIFYEVAQTGNISHAAQKLYVSQSAVSQSIRQLEQQLQTRLFSRTVKGVKLTAEGQMLAEYVSQALGLLQRGEEKLEDARNLQIGELVIGASDTVTKTYLLSRLEAFHKRYPGIRIRIRNGTSQMVLELLSSGAVDIAFATEPEDNPVYRLRRCIVTHSVFVSSPNYFPDPTHIFTMEEIADLPLILLERRASSRVHLEEFFLAGGISLRPEIELGSHNLLISLARIGLGVACVTEEFSQSGLGRGVIVKLNTDFEIPARAVAMCTLRAVSPTPAAERFMDFITESNRISYDLGHSYHFDSDFETENQTMDANDVKN